MYLYLQIQVTVRERLENLFFFLQGVGYFCLRFCYPKINIAGGGYCLAIVTRSSHTQKAQLSSVHELRDQFHLDRSRVKKKKKDCMHQRPLQWQIQNSRGSRTNILVLEAHWYFTSKLTLWITSSSILYHSYSVFSNYVLQFYSPETY